MEENDLTHDSGRPQYKALYEERGEEIEQLNKDKRNLEENTKQLESNIEKLNTKISELQVDSRAQENKIKTLNETISDRDRTIKENELRRFSAAYEKQEREYRSKQNDWFNYSLIATVALTSSVLFSIVAPSKGWATGQWYEQPGFYLLNAIFLTLFVYSLKQHSYFGKLIVDYANRKTLAQSYQHIVEDEKDEEIKTGFLKEIVKIFAAAPNHEKESVTVWEYLLNRKKS